MTGSPGLQSGDSGAHHLDDAGSFDAEASVRQADGRRQATGAHARARSGLPTRPSRPTSPASWRRIGPHPRFTDPARMRPDPAPHRRAAVDRPRILVKPPYARGELSASPRLPGSSRQVPDDMIPNAARPDHESGQRLAANPDTASVARGVFGCEFRRCCGGRFSFGPRADDRAQTGTKDFTAPALRRVEIFETCGIREDQHRRRRPRHGLGAPYR